MTVPWKRLRWAMAQCLLLWRFHPPPPARAATLHRSCLACCDQLSSLPISAPPVNHCRDEGGKDNIDDNRHVNTPCEYSKLGNYVRLF
jgi:hypothetical protein